MKPSPQAQAESPKAQEPESKIDSTIVEQLEELTLDAERPLIVSDADGVLLQFVERFQPFLKSRGLWFDLKVAFQAGAIKSVTDGSSVKGDDIPKLIDDFFLTETENIAPIADAAPSLQELARHAQIAVLSNLPLRDRGARRKNLRAHGMDYPVIAGSGPKGPVLGWLQARVRAPIFFLDDIHHHIDSVADHVPNSRRIHFVGHPELAQLAPQAKRADTRLNDWNDARVWIKDELARQGY